MEEVTLAPEEFVGLVDVFKLLRKWRDERNQTFMEKDTMDAETQEEQSCD